MNKIDFKFEIELFIERVKEFFVDWIYPAYYLKNLLFNRYDVIKIDGVKPWQYCDTNYKMFVSNMKLIVDFIEKKKPEKYICWYKDEKDNDVGHKYGECKKTIPMMFPEYEGKWIMDIIKEIYHWYKVKYPELLNDKDVFCEFYLDNYIGKLDFEKMNEESKDKELVTVYFDKSDCPKTKEELMKKNFNKEVIKKYLPNEEDWFNEDIVREKFRFIEAEIERQKLKYSHLCIEVMEYLWT